MLEEIMIEVQFPHISFFSSQFSQYLDDLRALTAADNVKPNVNIRQISVKREMEGKILGYEVNDFMLVAENSTTPLYKPSLVGRSTHRFGNIQEQLYNGKP